MTSTDKNTFTTRTNIALAAAATATTSEIKYQILYLKLHGMAAMTRVMLAIGGVEWESTYPTVQFVYETISFKAVLSSYRYAKPTICCSLMAVLGLGGGEEAGAHGFNARTVRDSRVRNGNALSLSFSGLRLLQCIQVFFLSQLQLI